MEGQRREKEREMLIMKERHMQRVAKGGIE